MEPCGGGEIPPPFGPSKNVPIKSSVPKPPTQSIPTRLCVCVVYSFDLSQWCKQRNSDDGHSFRQLAPVLVGAQFVQHSKANMHAGIWSKQTVAPMFMDAFIGRYRKRVDSHFAPLPAPFWCLFRWVWFFYYPVHIIPQTLCQQLSDLTMDRANSHTYGERTPMFRSVLFTSAQICTNNAPEPIRETRDDVSAEAVTVTALWVPPNVELTIPETVCWLANCWPLPLAR